MATAAPANPILMNAQARSIVVGSSVQMTQQILSTTFDPTQQQVLNIPPRNVGLLLGFIVEVSGTVLNTAAAQLNRTDFGSSNIVKNFTFTDLNNVQRINTDGRHLALLNSARNGFGFGGCYAPNLPMNYGNSFAPFSGPATIAAGANTGLVRHSYYVPIAYSQNDLRGSIYAAVVNATMNLQLTINGTPCVGATDPGNAIYSGNAAGAWNAGASITVKVWQVYLDQLPTSNGQPILPMLDLNTIYDLKNTVQTGLAVGQDFPVAYANFRQFLSTIAIYQNGGVYNVGTDINTWALTAANSTNIFKYSPNVAALNARAAFMSDIMPGSYYFDHRSRPIDTITFGNMELVVNPITVGANSSLFVGYEAFQQVNQLPVASSLAS